MQFQYINRKNTSHFVSNNTQLQVKAQYSLEKYVNIKELQNFKKTIQF